MPAVQLQKPPITLSWSSRTYNWGYLDDLGGKRYSALAKKLSVSIDKITEAANWSLLCEPKPVRNYRPIDPTIYVEPDIYVRKNEEGKYIVETNKNAYLPLDQPNVP